MANVDLSNQEGAEAVEEKAIPQQHQETLPAKAEPKGLILGDKVPEFKEIILPRINIVQGVGVLKDTFPQGAIIHGQSTLIYEPTIVDPGTGNVKKKGTPPLVITVLGFRDTRYAEKVKGGGRGLIVSSEEEVRKNGGTLDYKEWELKEKDGMKRFEPLVDALVLIERPSHCKDDDTIFTFPHGGKKYALALWGMKGSAYTRAAKKVFFTQRAMGCLKIGGYPSYSFTLCTKQESWAGNTYYVPLAAPLKKHSPEFLAWCRDLLTCPTKDTEDTE